MEPKLAGIISDRPNRITHRDIFGPDVVGALDYEAAHGKVLHRTGEEKLLLALIESAIKALVRGSTGKIEGSQKAAESAKAWIGGSTADDALSFAFCCEHLGFDASYLTRGLLSEDAAQLERLVHYLKPRMVLGPGGPVATRMRQTPA